MKVKSWHKLLHLFLAVSLFIGLVGINWVSQTSHAPNLQPLLSQLADEKPGRMVSVIIQARGDVEQVENLVESLDGKVTRDLSIINAISAELPAKAVTDLARSNAVRWVSLDAPMEMTGKKPKNPPSDPPPPPEDPDPAFSQVFLDTLNVRAVWDMGYQGDGIAVVIIDSGIEDVPDFNETTKKNSPTRIKDSVTFNPNSTTVDDFFGHGTHIAGIVGGNGQRADEEVSGIAPKVDLINLKVSDEQDAAFESDAVAAMQWVLENKDAYNIRVVNLSIHSTVPQSYHTSPIDAAAEILWFNSIVVVTSAGNQGPNAVDYAPANDPFIITVGASHENYTADKGDDVVTEYSAYGETVDGFTKPDLIAPGQDIISVLSDESDWDYYYPNRMAMNGPYFRLSGTSMSAPMVAGAVALLLESEPDLTPDQVKYRLMTTGTTVSGASGDPSNYPYLDVYAAVTGSTTESANTGTTASQMLWTGEEPLDWDSVNWNSVNWNSVNWNSVNWNSVNWNSVNWNSIAWDH